jgi:nitrate reductase gamma subunit
MASYFHELIFGFYPYLVMGVFFTGTIMRYKTAQDTWNAGSSQFLANSGMRLGINLFHVTIIILFFSHLFGLLTAKYLYTTIISVEMKQFLAMRVGGTVGALCFLGMTMLVIRRFTEPRLRPIKSLMDDFILLLIYAELIVGLLTIPSSAEHPKGQSMLALCDWAQHIITFRAGAASLIINEALIFKLHLFLGMTIFLIFPFSHLVHAISVPISYLFRKNTQIVRKR